MRSRQDLQLQPRSPLHRRHPSHHLPGRTPPQRRVQSGRQLHVPPPGRGARAVGNDLRKRGGGVESYRELRYHLTSRMLTGPGLENPEDTMLHRSHARCHSRYDALRMHGCAHVMFGLGPSPLASPLPGLCGGTGPARYGTHIFPPLWGFARTEPPLRDTSYWADETTIEHSSKQPCKQQAPLVATTR